MMRSGASFSTFSDIEKLAISPLKNAKNSQNLEKISLNFPMFWLKKGQNLSRKNI